MPAASTPSHGPLRPMELASAAVMATVAAILTVAGWFLPHLGIVAAFAVVPLGVVAHHHRLRALLAATFAASVLSFLVAGTGSVTNVVECAAVGGLIGVVKRRGWGAATVVAGVLVIGPVLAAVSDGLLWVFSGLRKLTIEQIRNTWTSIRHILLVVPSSAGPVAAINSFVLRSLHLWWASVAVVIMAATAWFAVVGWVFLGAVLERLEWIRVDEVLGRVPAEERARVEPLPARLEAVSYRYPGAATDALAGVDLALEPGEMLAVVGDNGSGKSTLVRVLGGIAPTAGSVTRPGGVGLGRRGGTALIMQHPETQVLGVRVADDVVWGLDRREPVDVESLLDAVGLAGFADRETSGLSGGELQRLAVAAALARRPKLLLSDESTAMVDEPGREDMVALLRRLPGRDGVTVVHVTHRPEEAAVADRVQVMERGRFVPGRRPVLPPSPAPLAAPRRSGAETLDLIGVSHTYGVGTPWANEALVGIDLSIEPGEGVLVVGGNGSGKSTLAWVMAGLLRPTFGQALLGGRPVLERIGAVGLAFQHARLQLQRATVGRDLRAAGAADDGEVAAALASVGLDPGMADLRIDSLSGGQQRRVALAGILSRRPSVLVLDEPLAGLDRPSREGLLDLLSALRRQQGTTLVVISHDLHGMERVCERVVRLDAGRIVSDTETMAAGL